MAGVIGFADIDYDLAGTLLATDRLAAFDRTAINLETARRLHDRYYRSWQQGYCTGRALVSLCDADTRTRYRTLLCVEATFHPDGDYGFLIAPACQIFEIEVDRVVLKPARQFGEALVRPLEATGEYSDQAEILRRWLRGQTPPTLGVASLVLLALRKWWEADEDAASREIGAAIRSPVSYAIRMKELGKAVDLLRTRFRNPACHGTALFDAREYAEFAELAVGQQCFAGWDVKGPHHLLGRSGDGRVAGILHLHLEPRQAVGSSRVGQEARNRYEAEWEELFATPESK
jgi:hypothetical protein